MKNYCLHHKQVLFESSANLCYEWRLGNNPTPLIHEQLPAASCSTNRRLVERTLNQIWFWRSRKRIDLSLNNFPLENLSYIQEENSSNRCFDVARMDTLAHFQLVYLKIDLPHRIWSTILLKTLLLKSINLTLELEKLLTD